MTPRLPPDLDAERFRRDGHALVDVLAGYLSDVLARADVPVLPPVKPADAVTRWTARLEGYLSGHEPMSVPALVARVITESNHLHHPRYVGHQVTSPLPDAALAELASALLNNGMAVFEMGPAATAMERSVISWLARALGYSADQSDGVLTSGGSAGNLTALLAARQHGAGFDVWERGVAGGPPLSILTSAQSHYSVRRSAQIMGLGGDGVEVVPVDDRFSLRPEGLDDAYARAVAKGRRVIAVVASACSTATGSFDPLDAIADFCAAKGLWMHVDGAHGAAVALTERYRDLVRGIDRADSVVWDAHKMMLAPALVTAVLFRERRGSYEAFSQEASYLFAGRDPTEEWFNGAVRTLECTKKMMSLPVFTVIARLGREGLGRYVESRIDLARSFAGAVRASSDFELAVEPACNIVCFRHVPDHTLAPEALDALQARLRAEVLDGGRFYLVQTKLPAGLFLRVTIINPETNEADLAELLDHLREVARTLA
ncbi:aminotransferase class I/II-fold pyridoxal phosphate-dependent enzyme [Myxococcota bacterium]|nr:aminotransferase class I/II-fold pyridoxal phosphate-dependent enzyme [Myxococcota bacterium]